MDATSKYFLFIVLLISLLLLSGCTKSISDVKSEELVGEKVTVSGVVDTSIKLGSLSGYSLHDDSGSIFVSSDNLPAEGKRMTVTGVLRKSLLGYYIED